MKPSDMLIAPLHSFVVPAKRAFSLACNSPSESHARLPHISTSYIVRAVARAFEKESNSPSADPPLTSAHETLLAFQSGVYPAAARCNVPINKVRWDAVSGVDPHSV